MSDEKILALIAEVVDDDGVLRDRDIDLFDTGLLDSLGFITLFEKILDDFNVELQPTQVDKEELRTPNGIIHLIQSKIENNY